MHILYTDESGDDGLVNTKSRVFLRTALILHDRQWRKVNNAMLDLRYKWKIPPEIELHATEIRRGKARIYRSKVKCEKPNWFGSNYPNCADRIKILVDACALIADYSAITLLCIVFNKQKYDLKNQSPRLLPKNITWELLIERYNLFLKNQRDQTGIIIADAINDKIEKQQRDFAKSVFRDSAHIQSNHFIESILFEPSDSSNMLQLADIASYAFFRKFDQDDDRFYNIISPRIMQNELSEIDGAGLKKWPE